MTTTKKPTSLLEALATVLPMLEGAKKNAANPHFKSKYADLGSVIDAIRPAAEHGIWFRQIDLERPNGAAVETFYIGHGEEISAGITFVPADRNNAQGYGSAKTYARRYGLLNAFGLSSEDDDGNAAAEAPPKDERKPNTQQKPRPITDAQYEELMQLFDHLNVPVGGFLKVANIANLESLPANWFDRAKGWVNEQAKAKRETTAEAIDDEIPY